MDQFLIGAGLALLVALLAWSDQIRSLHRDTLEAEKYLNEKRHLSWKVIKMLIRKKASPQHILDVLNDMLQKQSAENIKDIHIIYQFRGLDNKAKTLERLYSVKYILVIILTFLFFFSGIATWLIDNNSTFDVCHLTVKWKSVPAILCITFALCTLVFIIYLNSNEARYRTDFISLMDQI